MDNKKEQTGRRALQKRPRQNTGLSFGDLIAMLDYAQIHIGAIQVLRNADGGGGVSDFLEKSVTKV